MQYRKLQHSPTFWASIGIIGAIGLSLIAWQHGRLHRDIRVALSPNIACANGLTSATQKGLQVPPTVQQRKTAYYHDPNGRIAAFICNVNKNSRDMTKGQSVAQIDSNGYQLGATVIYFNSTQDAQRYAESVVNPERYWSVYGTSQGVPQTDAFTSFVGSNSTLYFDAYTVTDTALIRISLPCTFPESEPGSYTSSLCEGTDVSNSMATQILYAFAQAIPKRQF